MNRLVFLLATLWVHQHSLGQIRISTFHVDASPRIGSPLAYDPTIAIQNPLSCRGIIIQSSQKPVILCSIDWLGVANGSQTEFKEAFAAAAGTTTNRVSIHAVHQHDAPRCDASAEKILSQYGYGKKAYDPILLNSVISRSVEAISKSMRSAQTVTHLGLGKAAVKMVASNRRILGPDGKVKITRYTATKDPAIRDLPVGTIDPFLKMISFWNNSKPVAVLTFYATHPQSYYRTGKANVDFPGMARNAREQETGIPHIHFNGAGGNIGAGKWNDGSPGNRKVLAKRVEVAMLTAWNSTEREVIDANSLKWQVIESQLPLARGLDKKTQIAVLEDRNESDSNHLYAAKHLAWINRTETKQPVSSACLTLNHSKTLLMPGELFVEYQLEAQKMDPHSFVTMAAYSEYGCGYIGTKIGYSQGGYETSPRASRVGPGSERILMNAMNKLLGAN